MFTKNVNQCFVYDKCTKNLELLELDLSTDIDYSLKNWLIWAFTFIIVHFVHQVVPTRGFNILDHMGTSLTSLQS